ncbi:MAG: preprotein translocase subunit SecE [Xanthomonadales bacterium]|jgi:preprotein translocase subunit SecE|nr:preprotein translocase subunit SecE [Gammaproteobacteria bacterium]MBT8074357.1 preprotein translocase subunit SecE [Gammaproteobacteria bacterium]MBT8076313.1 preprotein translocase subunit SecE [Gammaproteobacteria bacterium]NNK05210.1 preprotein translocase subunit SecE [Xanthomonadales bacterium]
MNSKVENTRSAFTDTLLLLISVIMLLGGIGAYYYFQDLAITPVRVAALIAVTLIAAWIAGQSHKGATFFRFLKEADIERRKVVWPTHQEAVQTSLMVIVVVIIISLFLASVDWMIGAAVRSLLSGGG